jgi:hypothetical protein
MFHQSVAGRQVSERERAQPWDTRTKTQIIEKAKYKKKKTKERIWYGTSEILDTRVPYYEWEILENRKSKPLSRILREFQIPVV